MRTRSIALEFLVVAAAAFVSGTAVTLAWNLAVEGRPTVNWALMIALAVGIAVSMTWRTVACSGRSAGAR
jgi:hypothetical protein